MSINRDVDTVYVGRKRKQNLILVVVKVNINIFYYSAFATIRSHGIAIKAHYISSLENIIIARKRESADWNSYESITLRFPRVPP